MYTPQFSQTATVTVRRLAWALGLSMPKAVDKIINQITAIFSPSAVCPLCKDSTKCKSCGFYQPAAEKEGAQNAA
jgi:recombinational DNA repair protein RecR